jgi:hypothetical protein
MALRRLGRGGRRRWRRGGCVTVSLSVACAGHGSAGWLSRCGRAQRRAVLHGAAAVRCDDWVTARRLHVPACEPGAAGLLRRRAAGSSVRCQHAVGDTRPRRP